VTSFLLKDPHVSEGEKAQAREKAVKLFGLARRYAQEIRL